MSKNYSLPSELNSPASFEEVQQQVRWHYQWVVLHDFLPTILGQKTLNLVLPHLASGKSIFEDKPQLKFFHWKKYPFIPIEFTVAVYRFGHSMVRPLYRLNNNTLKDVKRQDIFSTDPNTSLVGFREFPSNWAIDWNLFFNPGNAPTLGPDRIQKSYKIDTSLVNPLGHLPGSIAAKTPSLAERNLVRGMSFGLPSGQTVAKSMQLPIISDDDLRVGKATEEDTKSNPRLIDIAPGFKGNAPLWYYILAEAQQAFKKDETPIRLGPVGGRIVAEVFIGLLLGDQYSFLAQDPSWVPNLFDVFESKKEFKMIDLINEAIKS